MDSFLTDEESPMIIRCSGTLFIDLDGTFWHLSSDVPLPYAVERINEAYDKGYMIVFTTMRGNGEFGKDGDYPQIEDKETVEALKKTGVKWHHIVWNCPSPRNVINDEGANAYNHISDGSWKFYKFH